MKYLSLLFIFLSSFAFSQDKIVLGNDTINCQFIQKDFENIRFIAEGDSTVREVLPEMVSTIYNSGSKEWQNPSNKYKQISGPPKKHINGEPAAIDYNIRNQAGLPVKDQNHLWLAGSHLQKSAKQQTMAIALGFILGGLSTFIISNGNSQVGIVMLGVSVIVPVGLSIAAITNKNKAGRHLMLASPLE